MKTFLLFCLALVLSAALTFVATTSSEKMRIKQDPPKLTTAFSFQKAPTDSLVGQITSLTGDVSWQSRIATEPAQLTTIRTLSQGENIRTKDNGKLSVNFPDSVSLTLLAHSEVDIIQTLPSSIVFVQQDGTVLYTTSGKTPVGIRSQDVLIQQKQGAMRLIVDKTLGTVTVQVTDGTATAAYTDSDNTSIVTPIASGQTFSFDDASLTGTMQ